MHYVPPLACFCWTSACLLSHHIYNTSQPPTHCQAVMHAVVTRGYARTYAARNVISGASSHARSQNCHCRRAYPGDLALCCVHAKQHAGTYAAKHRSAGRAYGRGPIIIAVCMCLHLLHTYRHGPGSNFQGNVLLRMLR